MCRNRSGNNRDYRRSRSPKVKFYRGLRAFVIFNFVMAVLMFMTGGSFEFWKISMIWSIILGVRYIKAFGWPGADGWLSDDWQDWMEERERHRSSRPSEPEPLELPEPQPIWREKDLV